MSTSKYWRSGGRKGRREEGREGGKEGGVTYPHGVESPRALLHAMEALPGVFEDIGRPRRRRQQVFLRCVCGVYICI